MSGVVDVAWTVASCVILAGGLGPALFLAARAGALDRLVGLLMAGSSTTLLLVVLTALQRQPSFLIVPLVLVLLSFAGTLVFTRLLGRSG